jgi:hypothetical protein
MVMSSAMTKVKCKPRCSPTVSSQPSRNGSGSDIPGGLTTLHNPPNQTKTKRRTPRCSRQAFQCGCLVSQGNENKRKTVTESSLRRKKRGGLDVFQFAETVEPEAWGDRAKDLQVRAHPYLSFCFMFPATFLSRTVFLHLSESKR